MNNGGKYIQDAVECIDRDTLAIVWGSFMAQLHGTRSNCTVHKIKGAGIEYHITILLT